MNTKPSSVEGYMSSFPTKVQAKLKQLRNLILTEVNDVDEGISYGMVGYKLHKKPLVYFGAYAKHIGLYALPNTHQKFSKQLINYNQGKGSVQFPLDQELPVSLIKEMLAFRVSEIAKQNQ